MSTKTSIKRIAAVAAVALTLGGFSAVSAHAYDVQAGFRTLSWAATPASTGTTNVEWSAVVKAQASCGEYGTGPTTVYATTTAQLDAAPIGSNLLSNTPTWATGTPTGYTNVNATAAEAAYKADTTSYKYATQVHCVDASSALTAYSTVKFTPDKAGAYVLVILPNGATTGALTQSITVTDPVVKSSTAFVNTDLSSPSTADAAAASLVFASTANTTAKARLTVKQYSTTDTTTVATDAISQAVVVAISKGLVSKTNDYSAAASSVTTAAATAATNNYYVFANGTSGSASLTITVGGTLVATKTIVFNGAATSLSATLTTGQKTWIAPTQSATLTVAALDSSGNAASNTPTITATSSSTAVATVVATSNTLVTITGVAAGDSVITIADSATTSPAASATYKVHVTAATTSATLPTLTFDKSSYNPGDLMTITVSADASDNASFAAFTANPVASQTLVTLSNPFTTGAVALVGGKATWTAYAPLVSGPLSVSATSGSGSSATAATVSASTTIAASSAETAAQAAVDAANEATDAANAATDAANNAMDSADAAQQAALDAGDKADAALAAVTDLASKVADIATQISALSSLVSKIAASVAKISAKVKA